MALAGRIMSSVMGANEELEDHMHVNPFRLWKRCVVSAFFVVCRLQLSFQLSKTLASSFALLELRCNSLH